MGHVMTVEIAANRDRRKRRRLIKQTSIILLAVIAGGVIADRVIVAYLGERPLATAPDTRAFPDIFARSPGAGKAVTMPIEAPDLLGRDDGDDPARVDRRLASDNKNATVATAPPPRRWFVETGEQPIDALAQAPVHLSEDWYGGFARPSAGPGRLPKGSDPRADDEELVVEKQIKAQLKREGAF